MIAVDLATGKLKWWQQQIALNEWAYDTSQPPIVYTAKIGGKSERIVSVATMEGVWFAYDAATGAPIYQRVKVLDNVEHPNLVPGQAGRGLPVLARWPELLARLVRPADELRLQRGVRDRVGLPAADAGTGADSAAAAREYVPGPGERRLRLVSPDRAGATTARSARSMSRRQAGLEVQDARARARRRDDDRRRGSASPAAATAICARSTRRPGRCCGRSRPAVRSPPALRSTRSTARSTSRSRSAARRPRRAAARSRASCRSSRSAGARTQSPAVHDRLPAADRAPHRVLAGERASAHPRARAATATRRSREDRHPGRPDRPAVGPEHVEHPGRPGPRRPGRQAGERVQGERQRLGRAADRRQRERSTTRSTTRCPARHVVTVASADRREDRRQAAHRRRARAP